MKRKWLTSQLATLADVSRKGKCLKHTQVAMF